MRNVRIDNEAGAQETLFSWVNYQLGRYPELELLHHIPNGGKRDARTAANLKRQGVKAGVPDLCLPVARGGYHGLYIELKVGKNKQSESQKKWQQQLTKQGYLALVCYGWEDAAQALTKYLQLGTLKESGATASQQTAQDTLAPAT